MSKKTKRTEATQFDASLYDVLVRPVVTEKATLAAEQGKAIFEVSPTACKARVKTAVEKIFGVSVTKVNMLVTEGKTKRFRGRIGKRSDVKKAIVTLKQGDSIDIAAGVR